MWESRLSGSVRGRRATEGMEKILWHRRESRRKTEKTNIFLQPREAPAYSKILPEEAVEGRGLTKGNLFRQNKFWTQYQERTGHEG
jgi:hypothetical protein